MSFKPLRMPQPGDALSSHDYQNLVREVRATRRLQSPDVRVQRGPNGTSIAINFPAKTRIPDKPLPYEVRWSASETSSGAWVIWLPDLAHLVSYGDTSISTIIGVSAAQNLPSGWYTVSGLASSSTAVYLVVAVTDATGVATAEIAPTTALPATGETVYNLVIANLATDSSTGAKSVKQLITSAVNLGGGGNAITIGTPKVVEITTEWVGPSHADYNAHPHTLKVVRGNLTLTNGVLTAVEDSSLAQYIETTAISSIISGS